LHNRTFRECEVYRGHVRSHLNARELETYGHTTELVMYRVFSILADPRTTREVTKVLIARARQDKQAMRVQWFSKLVGQAVQSAGCAVALEVLLPTARQQGLRYRRMLLGALVALSTGLAALYWVSIRLSL
jgi:hypothetical protein